jgi:hypothetical protein
MMEVPKLERTSAPSTPPPAPELLEDSPEASGGTGESDLDQMM